MGLKGLHIHGRLIYTQRLLTLFSSFLNQAVAGSVNNLHRIGQKEDNKPSVRTATFSFKDFWLSKDLALQINCCITGSPVWCSELKLWGGKIVGCHALVILLVKSDNNWIADIATFINRDNLANLVVPIWLWPLHLDSCDPSLWLQIAPV